MESYLTSAHYDLVTPDGKIESVKNVSENSKEVILHFNHISPFFVGFLGKEEYLYFNIKSTLAQMGITGDGLEYSVHPKHRSASARVLLHAIDPLGRAMLELLDVDAFIGKLFVKDPQRRVRDPDYLFRMFGRCDREGRALLSLGGFREKELVVDKIDGRCIAYLTLKEGIVVYEDSIYGLLPTLRLALKNPGVKTRELLQFHQRVMKGRDCVLEKDRVLLVKTAPLHIRTVFGCVAEELLPKGFRHTTASILEPDTMDSGDIYEFFGHSTSNIYDIPLEFYTLEPHREHVFFADRDQLQASLEDPNSLFRAFETAPPPKNHEAAVFVVKGDQLQNLKPVDWIVRDPKKHDFPGMNHPSRQLHLVETYIENQPSYPFLKAIENGLITSQGILLSRYFPSSLLKRLILNDIVQTSLKQIYFEFPSRSSDQFFAHEDRSMLLDLARFSVGVFWVDRSSHNILRYVLKPQKDTGMFVPLKQVETFRKATAFGIYGSNLLAGTFEHELRKLFDQILQFKENAHHPLLNKDIPILLVTGGGPGAMEVGNRVAKSLGILSCANIVDFRKKTEVIHEQKQNPYIDAKMTYQLDRLIERQAEFYLDFPIFLMGGIGMDFEYTLEEVRRKVGAQPPTPILLFGEKEYWKEKVSHRFQANLKAGTIKGSEWVSNCFYCVQTAEKALSVYQKFTEGKLEIGRDGPIYEDGFCTVE